MKQIGSLKSVTDISVPLIVYIRPKEHGNPIVGWLFNEEGGIKIQLLASCSMRKVGLKSNCWLAVQ